MKKNSKENIEKALKSIKHPAIDETLFNLGIIKKIEFEEEKAIIYLAFPFENIPIKETLIELVKKPLVKFSVKGEIKTSVMKKNELEKFLKKEQEHWLG